MINFSTLAGKMCAVFALVVLCGLSICAQPGPTGHGTGNLRMREAMDTDHDGKADMSIFRPSDQNWWILRSSGGITVQHWGDPNDDAPTPGDYDGDGKGDISVWRDSTGTWFTIRSSDSTISAIQWGASGDEPVSRDYDGDGITDLAVVRRTGGNMIWYVVKSTGGIDATQWGLSTDFATPGDYDGDGKFDYTIQRPGATLQGQATYFVLKSTGGVETFDFGITSDLAVPGDYDGDGITDFAIVREQAVPNNNLVWYIFQSSTSTTIAVPWGDIGDDLCVQNDYDGDGKTDIAIWRASTGTFFIIQSTGGVNATQWGASGDFPVAAFDTH